MEKLKHSTWRMPAKLHRRLVRAARAGTLSLNAYAVLAVQEKMDRDQEARKQAAQQVKAGGAG